MSFAKKLLGKLLGEGVENTSPYAAQAAQETGNQGLPRNIYFADGEVMVDIANKELFIRDKWYSASQIKRWESLTGGAAPYFNIYLDDPAMPIYEYKTVWVPKHQQLQRGLNILAP